MKINLMRCFSLILFIPLHVINAYSAEGFIIPRSEVVSIKDTVSYRNYKLYIKLPLHYSNKKKYKAVYMMDGMYSFPIISGSTRFPINFGKMENIMLVGISWETNFNAGLSRQRDYTPTKDDSWKDPTGEASDHLRFIRNDVINYIEKRYNTDPQNRTFIGNSLGGLFGAYVLFHKPDTFKNYILGSPSFWYHDKVIFDIEEKFSKHHKSLERNLYIAIGENETPKRSGSKYNMVEDAQNFNDIVKSRGYEGLNMKLEIIPSAHHSTAFPTTAMHGLWWLFKK